MTNLHKVHLEMPEPVEVKVNWPEPAAPSHPPSPWSEPSKYQREIAKWIVGGVLAAVVGVVAGSPLTNLGQLSFDSNPVRLITAIAGALVGFVAIGVFLHLALRILSVEVGSIENLKVDPASKTQSVEWRGIARDVASYFAYELRDSTGNSRPLADVIALRGSPEITDRDRRTLRQIRAALGFLFVQRRYKAMIGSLKFVGPAAIIGFGVFAWAANPPDEPKPERPGITIKIAN